jgi:hypothetical protein
LPKLTKEFVDRASPGTFFDSDLPGFVLDVGKKGVKTFFVYRPKGTGRNGPRRYFKIGRYGVLPPAEARSKARGLLGAVASGGSRGRDGAGPRRCVRRRTVSR